MNINSNKLFALTVSLAVCVGMQTQAAVVFTDNFDNTNNYPEATYTTGTEAEFLAHGWTAVLGSPQGSASPNMGVGIAGGSTPPESTFWGNATHNGNTEAALEYSHTNAPINCGDIIMIEANAIRLTVYTYIEEIILWDGVNPGTRVTATNWTGLGVSPAWLGWWSPPQKGPINTLVYHATEADAGKYVIFKYGHGSSWSETADVTFSITPVTSPVIAQEPGAPSTNVVRSVGESLTLTTEVWGCGLNYQWYKGASPVSGATSSTLQLTSLTTGDAGDYSCTITNGHGSTNTVAVSLTVEPKIGGGASTSLGINFGDEEPYNPTVTAPAFGLHESRWQDTPPGNESGAVSGYQDFPLGSGNVSASWTAANTYSLAAALPTVGGEPQVTYGYLDDGGSGYYISMNGLTTSVGYSNYVVRLVAANDQASNTNFLDATVDDFVTPQTLSYPPSTSIAGGTMAVSASSAPLTADFIAIYAPPGVGANNTRSSLAGILITDKPALLVQPQAPTNALYMGVSFSLTSDAFGVPPLAYQWKTNGVPIPDATNATYMVASATPDDSGVYTLEVTNAYGSATSTGVTISVSSFFSPVIDTAPVSRTTYVGGSAVFSVAASGGSLSYQWKKGGVGGTDLTDATNATLSLTGLALADDSDYTVVVSNPIGTNSATAHLTVLPVPSAGVYLGAVLADSPNALWRLSETSGTTVYDSWGVNDGAYVGAVGLGLSGIISPDTSALFTNTGWTIDNAITYAEVPYSAAINPSGPFSVEFWAKPNSVPGDLFSPIVSVDTGAGRSGYVFYINGGSGWQFRLGNAGGYVATVSGGTSSTGWTHVVGVYDGSQAFLYVNGVKYGPVTPSAAFAPNSTQPTYIGANPDFGRNWNGLLDEVAVYDYALTPEQIQNHTFFVTPFKVGMASATNIIEDTKPTGALLHGINIGAAWAASESDSIPNTRTGVMQLPGTAPSGMKVWADPAFNSPTGTITFWMKTTQNTTANGHSIVLLDRRAPASAGDVIVMVPGSGYLAHQAQTAGGLQANSFTGYTPLNDGNWHHVAYTYDQSASGIVAFYIDGTLETSGGNTAAWSWPASQQLELGWSHDSWWASFIGSMDDVMIYNRILSDPEILGAASGTPVTDSSLVARYNFDRAPVSGYQISTTPVPGTILRSGSVDTGYTPAGTSPKLHVPSGNSQFFRAQTP